ncbi:MAG TPA: carbon-nitrogen family hydrolase [Clostridiales bacterium]|nr:carbon-nitrogen family hydrolase [Clostridiales bacterium]
MKLKIALVQMNVALGKKVANREKIISLLQDLPERCDFLVLPELWNTGYDLKHLKALAETTKEESMAFLREIAAKHKVNVIGGSIAEKRDEGIYNMLPVIDRKGELLHKYRKVHLFPYGIDEPAIFEQGNEWGLCETDCGIIGTMLCYDLRFPAFCRNLALRKAEIIFVPAQWPLARADHFSALLKARAIENQLLVVGVNRVGEDAIAYGGGSLAVAADGSELLQGDDREGLFVFETDITKDNEMRKKIPVYHDRRNILDEIDNNMI